jgi:hypothetical protein
MHADWNAEHIIQNGLFHWKLHCYLRFSLSGTTVLLSSSVMLVAPALFHVTHSSYVMRYVFEKTEMKIPYFI